MRRLIGRFYRELRATVEPLAAQSMLDAGCGEGETLARLGALPPRVAAVDISDEAVESTAARHPGADVRRESVTALPFDEASFDLVLCLEVLEHIEGPAAALAELARVTRRDLVISVPHEPWFQLGSLLRGKYVGTLGNHPEHVNHWNPRSLRDFLERRVEVVSVAKPTPWLIAHCRPRSQREEGHSPEPARSAPG